MDPLTPLSRGLALSSTDSDSPVERSGGGGGGGRMAAAMQRAFSVSDSGKHLQVPPVPAPRSAPFSATSASRVKSTVVPASSTDDFPGSKGLSGAHEGAPCLVVVLWGANSGRTAVAILPALWRLFYLRRFPSPAYVVCLGCGNGKQGSSSSLADLRRRCAEGPSGWLPKDSHQRRMKRERWKAFWRLCYYIEEEDGVARLLTVMEELEEGHRVKNRLFCLCDRRARNNALREIEQGWLFSRGPGEGWTKILADQHCDYLPSASLFAINHHEECLLATNVDCMLSPWALDCLFRTRFGIVPVRATWGRQHVASVTISFCFSTVDLPDQYLGVSGDPFRRHMANILALVAMEEPLDRGSAGVAEEKIKALRATAAVRPGEVTLGRAAEFGGGESGEEESSETESAAAAMAASESVRWEPVASPTYLRLLLRIATDRWEGIPFAVLCEKGCVTKARVSLRYRDESDAVGHVLPHGREGNGRTELELNITEDSFNARFLTDGGVGGNICCSSDLISETSELFPQEEILARAASNPEESGSLGGCVVSEEEMREANRILAPADKVIAERRGRMRTTSSSLPASRRGQLQDQLARLKNGADAD